MEIGCVWEHNGNDTLLYAADFTGAYTRGASLRQALDKMPAEVRACCRWLGRPAPDVLTPVVVQEKASALAIRDADSDVLLDTEGQSLTQQAYDSLKALALRSAEDFLTLYNGHSRKGEKRPACTDDLLRGGAAHGGADVSAHQKRQQLLFRRSRCGG